MSSPSKGFMFNIRPSRVSLVKHPANQREFLVTKSEEVFGMDEIIQIIQKTVGDNEEALVEALKAADKDEGTIQAALSVYRTFSAFRDSLTPEDFNTIAKAVEVEVPSDDEGDEVTKDDEKDVTKDKSDADDAAKAVEKTEDKVDETDKDADKDVAKSEEADDRVSELERELALLKANTRDDRLKAMIEDVKIGKSKEELLETLREADEAGMDVQGIVDSWRSASDVLKSALIEIGSELPGEVNEDVGKALDVEARRIAKDKGISFGAAYALIDDELVQKYYDK